MRATKESTRLFLAQTRQIRVTLTGSDTGGALAADANQEIWIYQVPAIADVDLTSGANLPIRAFVRWSLYSNYQYSRIPASNAWRTSAPRQSFRLYRQVADDNRDATISDDGNRIAFISTRNLVPSVGNADSQSGTLFLQSADIHFHARDKYSKHCWQSRPFSAFQQNPSLSSDGSVVAFLSSANLAPGTPPGNNDGDGRGNAEIYVANYDGAAISNVRQVTRTKDETKLVNSLHPGRRLSRDGSLIALESLAADPKANSATNEAAHAIFVYNIAADTFVQVGQRATSGNDVIRFPTFTDYNASLHPATLIFASALNFKPDGTFPPAAEASTG